MRHVAAYASTINDGTRIINWNPAVDGLRATGLRPTDKMDFTMVPVGASLGNTPSGWISNYAKIGTSGTKIRTL